MALKANEVINLLSSTNEKSEIVSLIFRYVALQEKLDHPEEQSWYFQKGIESKRKELIKIQASFQQCQNEFNRNTVDTLIERREHLKIGCKKIEKMNGWIIRSIGISNLLSEIFHINQMIHLKSKVSFLYPVDLYLDTPQEFIKLLVSSQVWSSNNLPVFFLLVPPHCLKKNLTSAALL